MEQARKYELGSSTHETERLRRQADTLSEEAHWLFDRLDIQPGWRVIDVGCGPMGVLELLSGRVGTSGSVTGLDASPAFVEQARALVAECGQRNIEVVHGDAGDPQLPLGTFDLVHARLLFINLPPPMITKVAKAMVALAKPGGIIAVQDLDGGEWSCDPPHPSWTKIFTAFKGVVGDGQVGRRLPRILREAGATNVKCDAHARFCPPGHLWRTMLLQFADVTRARAIELGLITAKELDDAKAELKIHLDNPNTTVLAPVLAQAWGRRPMSA